MSAPAPPTASSPPDFLARLERFWRRVTDGLELDQLWSQFKSDAQSSYRLYSKDIQPSSEPRRIRRFLHTAQQFAWAILEKLSPPRRVLLLLAVVLFLLPAGSPVHPDHLYCHTRYIYLAISFLYGCRFRGVLGSIGTELRRELYPAGYRTPISRPTVTT